MRASSRSFQQGFTLVEMRVDGGDDYPDQITIICADPEYPTSEVLNCRAVGGLPCGALEAWRKGGLL